MSPFDLPTFLLPRLAIRRGADTERIVFQQPLRRIMAFLGRSIDDVINDPFIQREVCGFFRLQKQVERACEVVDLERWWNGRFALPPSNRPPEQTRPPGVSPAASRIPRRHNDPD